MPSTEQSNPDEFDGSLVAAFRLLGQCWLEEVRLEDLETLQALPELAETLPADDEDVITELAVEYQTLFGFNLPPYESVFVDPAAMLMAPATARVQALYRQAGWQPPTDVRAGAPDYLGLELLALAEWLGQEDELARRLHTRHLALWLPPLVEALQRLGAHPFYTTLADLTLNLILATLPEQPLPDGHDPFPTLPPPPVYTAHGMDEPESGETEPARLHDLVRSLLTPRDTGLYVTRQDVAAIGRVLELPGVVGERRRMLTTLFRLAGQYDALADLHRELVRLFQRAGTTYAEWAAAYPAWSRYAHAWQQRLTTAQDRIADLATFDRP